MEKQFELLEITRKNILKEIEECSLDQLFTIPEGFNNHILWNAVHVIVTHQLLLYGLTSTPFRIDEAIIERYRKGTIPTNEVNRETVDFAKNNLISTASLAKEDYQNKVFGLFNSLTTSYGVLLNTAEDAISFLNIHEAMHYGQIKMLKRLTGG